MMKSPTAPRRLPLVAGLCLSVTIVCITILHIHLVRVRRHADAITSLLQHQARVDFADVEDTAANDFFNRLVGLGLWPRQVRYVELRGHLDDALPCLVAIRSVKQLHVEEGQVDLEKAEFIVQIRGLWSIDRARVPLEKDVVAFIERYLPGCEILSSGEHIGGPDRTTRLRKIIREYQS